MTIVYHKSDVQNAGIECYWMKVVEPFSADNRVMDVARPTADSSVLQDYKLLDTYREGRYLTVAKNSGYFVIAEIVLEFAEMRKDVKRLE